jgi:hypothetical protein
MAFYETASSEKYQELIDFIGTLPRPAKILPGSFGSFIFGCLYDTPSGEIMCSPACSNSIPPSVDIKPCSLQIWMYINGRMVYRSGVGEEANIFRCSGPSLTNEDVGTLAANGVRRTNLYSDNGTLLSSQPITTGPVTAQPPGPQVKAATGTPAANVAQNQPVVSTGIVQGLAIANTANGGVVRGSTSLFSDWRIILLVIIVIVAIVAFIYLLYKMSKDDGTKAQVGYQEGVGYAANVAGDVGSGLANTGHQAALVGYQAI